MKISKASTHWRRGGRNGADYCQWKQPKAECSFSAVTLLPGRLHHEAACQIPSLCSWISLWNRLSLPTVTKSCFTTGRERERLHLLRNATAKAFGWSFLSVHNETTRRQMFSKYCNLYAKTSTSSRAFIIASIFIYPINTTKNHVSLDANGEWRREWKVAGSLFSRNESEDVDTHCFHWLVPQIYNFSGGCEALDSQ